MARPLVSEKFVRVGVLAFFAQAVFSLVHLASGKNYPGFEYWPHTPIVDSLLTAAWIAGAVALIRRRSWMLSLGAVGTIASLAHGLYYSLSMPYVGIPFLIAAAVEVLCLRRVWFAFGSPPATRSSRL